VVAAREEFGARGTLRDDGDFKQWTNGNLQVLLEPTARGHQVRFASYSDATRAGLMGAAASIAVAGTMIVGPLVSGAGGMAGVYAGAGFVLAASLGIFGVTVGRAKSWAKLRRQQMQRLAARLERGTQSEAPKR